MKAFLACALVLALGACDAPDTEVAKTAASQSAASQGTATQSVTTQSVTTQIINWELVERERIDRTTVEFTYRADLQNAGPDMTGATAFALRAGTGTTLVEPTLRFARIGNGALVTSSDTFTIRHDREVAFDPDAVDWLVLSYGPETLVARERFDRDHVDFSYQAWLDNLGDSPTDLRARAYSTLPTLEILDPIIEADSLAPEQRSRSVDTFEIRQDRNFPFDPDSLRFELTAGDSTAPSIELAAPSAVQAGQPIQATATVSDDVGVSEVAFVVDGLPVTTLSAPPYVLFYNAPPNPGTVVEIRAQARDAAGNEGNALALVTVVAGDDPDTLPPVIDAVRAPPTVAPGETFQASALASDDRGIAEVCFAFTGPVPVCDDAPPYQVSLQVPGDAVAGTSLTIQATARDLSDNAASASVDTQVVVAPDNQPPTGVVISAPEEAYPGEPVELRAVAIDDVGILDIRFLADGVQLARDEEIPYAAFVTIPADLPAGSQIRWTAVASDFAGGSTESDPAITTIVARADGFVVGEVYDAYSGLALPGALAQFVGASEVTPDVAVPASSDSLGRYLLPSAEGDARLEITAPGYTSAFRPIAVPAGGVAEPLDARLMPLGPEASADPLADVELALENGAARLRVPAGALPEGARVWLTELDPQSLPLPLPPGWSPAFALDVRSEGAAFAFPLQIELPGEDFDANALLAFFDPVKGAWQRVPEASVQAGPGLRVEVAVPGALAMARPDVGDLAPPIPEDGAVLLGVAPIPLPEGSSASLEPSPRVLFAQPGARSAVDAVLDSPVALPSGTPIEVAFREHYEFTDGSTLSPETARQDVLLYRGEEGLRGGFPATPSADFETTRLQEGRIELTAEAPSEAPVHTLLPFAGGTLTSANDGLLTLPEAALAGPTPVSFRAVPSNPVFTRAGDYNALAAFELDVGGETLLASAQLTWTPDVLPPPDAQLLVIREVEVLGATRPELVALARLEGDQVVADDSVEGLALPGLRSGGRYHLVEMEVPLAFVTGDVSLEGAALARALVSAQALPFVSLLEGNEENYTVTARLAETGVSGIDLVGGNTGTATVRPTVQGEQIQLSLVLEAVGLSVSAVEPADGSVEVLTTDAVRVAFTRAVDPTSLGVGIALLDAEQPIAARIQLDPTGSEARLLPDVPLEGERVYTLRVTPELRDSFGNAFAGNLSDGSFEAAFTTRDTAPPPRPVAGQITAGEPVEGNDGARSVEVTGTLGSVEGGALVWVKNTQTGVVNSETADGDGSFDLQIEAGLTDELQLYVTDGANNTSELVNLGRPTPPEGFAVLGHDGGLIEREDGLAAVIPAGFLPEDSILSLEPADMTGVTTTPFANPEDGYIAGAVSLDLDGTEIGSVARFTFSVDGFPRFETVDTMPPFFEVDRTLDLPAGLQAGDTLVLRALAINEFGDEVELTGELPIVASSPDETPRSKTFESTLHLALELPTSATPGQSIPIRASAQVPDIKLRFPADPELTGDEEFLLYDIREISGRELWDLVTSANLVQLPDGSRVIETNSPPYRGVRRDTSRLVLAVQLQVAHSFAKFAATALTGFRGSPAAAASLISRATMATNQAFLGVAMIHQFSRPRPADLQVTEFGVVPLPSGQPTTLELIDLDTNAVIYSVELAALPPGEFSEVIVLGEDQESDLLVTSTNSPANGSVPLDANFTLTFSHLVETSTITDQTLKLIDESGASVSYRKEFSEIKDEDGNPKVIAVVINPVSRLQADHEYKIVASPGIQRVNAKRLELGFELIFHTAGNPAVVGSVSIPGAIAFDVIEHDYGAGEDENLALVSAYQFGGGFNGLVSVDLREPIAPMELDRKEFDETHSGRARGVVGIENLDLPGPPAIQGDFAAMTVGAADVFSAVRFFGIEPNGSLAPRAGALVSSPSGALIDSADLLVLPNVNYLGQITSIEVTDVYEGLFNGIPKTPAIPWTVESDGAGTVYFINQGIGLMTLDLARSIPTPPVEDRGTQFGPSFIPEDKTGAIVVSDPDQSLLVTSDDVEITLPEHLTLLEENASSFDRYVVVSGKVLAKDADRLMVNGVEAKIHELPEGAGPDDPRDFAITISLREGVNTLVATPFASGAELDSAQRVVLLPFSRNPLEGPGTVTMSLPPLQAESQSGSIAVTASVTDVTKFDKLFVNGILVSEKACGIFVINPKNKACGWSGTGATAVNLEPGTNAIVATAIDVDEDFFGEEETLGEPNPFGRTYFDMRVAEGLVLAVREDLFLYDASGLVEIATVDLDRAFRVSVAQGVFVDVDGDGKTLQEEEEDGDFVYAFDEIRNLALVGEGSGNRLVFVDITEPHKAEVIGEIKTVQPIYRADVVPNAGVAYVAAGDSVLLVDLSRAKHQGVLDKNRDGQDDRILKTIAVSGARDVELDASRGLAYVLQQNIGLTVLEIEDCDTDIGVDVTRIPVSRKIRVNKLKEEREKLYKGFANGFLDAKCAGYSQANVAILSQGSSACVWSEKDPRCSTAFQPGISDHDFEFFYQPTPGNPNDPAADLARAQACTQTIEEKILEELPGADVGVFAESRQTFEQSYRPVKRAPVTGCGVEADPFGDGCLGRNGLMHKWLLEGEWLQDFNAIPRVTWNGGMSLDKQLELLASPLESQYLNPDSTHTELSHVPLLEGYEWAVLQKYRVEETLARIRILGSEVINPDVVDPKLLTKLHKVGKAAIRTVLGALLATREGNDLLFESNRRNYRSRDGCLTKTPAPENVVNFPNLVGRFTRKPCETYEEYVASKAIETCLENPGLTALSCPEDALLAYEFFRIKSDVGLPPLTEEAANRFVARAINYVDGVVANESVTSAFDASIEEFLDEADRKENISKAEELTNDVLPGGAKFKVKVPVRLFNRGYGVAAPQQVDFYHDGDLIQSDRIVIGPPGGSRFLAKRFAAEAKIPPDPGSVVSVGLLLDPEDDVIEYDERNNFDGFFYYVLDDSCIGGWPDNCQVPESPNGELRPDRPDGDLPDASDVCLDSEGDPPDSPGIELVAEVNGLETFAFETEPQQQTMTQTFYVRNTGNTDLAELLIQTSSGDSIQVGVLPAGEQFETSITLPAQNQSVATQLLATVSGTSGGNGIGASSILNRVVPIQGFADLQNEPIIVIPGMAGSEIEGPCPRCLPFSLRRIYWPGIFNLNHRALTLDPDSPHFIPGGIPFGEFVATQPLETVEATLLNIPILDVYGQFITALESGAGTRPRFPNDDIVERNCPDQSEQSEDSVPYKLFVFPYDWRKSNAEHVEHLDWLVDCVERLHPNLRIHMVGHSMGGLLARRYVMEHPGHISKVVTIGTPWLGAAKVLNTLLTGEFLGRIQPAIITNANLKYVSESTPGVHELMPSRAYFEELGGRPFSDLERIYDYEDYAFIHDYVLHRRFPPVRNMDDFHDFNRAGNHQDDWRKDRTFAEYFHVYGDKGPLSTIESIQLKDRVVAHLENATGLEIGTDVAATAAVASDIELANAGSAVVNPTVDKEMGRGDGTVPLLSTTRRTPPPQLPPGNLNAESAWLWTPSGTDGHMHEHNGMLQNPEVQNFVLQILNPDPNTPLPAGLEPAVP